MTRKSKQAGGHQPLTHYERTKKFRSSAYGTTTERLTSDSQGRFGDCCLNLQPAVNPVATPSGHIYSQEAIVEYLLTKTQELKGKKQTYLTHVESLARQQQDHQQKETENDIQTFEKTQRATQAGTATSEKEESKSDILKKTSYWLPVVQPKHNERPPSPPPDRPASPNSGQPLRRKDLIPLKLERDKNDPSKVRCCVSHKAIYAQPVVVLKKGGHVVLEEVYKEVIQPTMICPITEKKLKEKHILTLQKGKSGFASSGTVQAKTYRPTIT